MSISVSNSLTLRLYYNRYSKLTTTSTRNNSTTGTLSMADATALRNAVKKLQDYDFEQASKTDIQEKVKAFTDIVNNTITTASKYGNQNSTIVKNAVSKIKDLNEKYSSDLKKIGITTNKDGTLSLYESASENYKATSFSKFFDKESTYLNDLYSAAQKITRRVDVRI